MFDTGTYGQVTSVEPDWTFAPYAERSNGIKWFYPSTLIEAQPGPSQLAFNEAIIADIQRYSVADSHLSIGYNPMRYYSIGSDQVQIQAALDVNQDVNQGAVEEYLDTLEQLDGLEPLGVEDIH